MEIVDITWSRFKKDIFELSQKIPKGKFNKILAVGMGGFIPAYYLSKILKIEHVETITVKSYNDLCCGEKTKVHPIGQGFNSNEKGWLIVDDLVDTGATLKYIKNKIPFAEVAVLYEKHHSFLVDFSLPITESGWINFPWEVDVSSILLNKMLYAKSEV